MIWGQGLNAMNNDLKQSDDRSEPSGQSLDEPQIVKNPLLNFVLLENFRTIKRNHMLVILTVLLFFIGISLEGSWGELFDAIKGWVIIGVLLAVWIGVVLFLSKIFGPKVAGALGAIIFLAVPIGLFIFIAACWGGGC